MTDFNHYDGEQMKAKAEEVAANTEKVIEGAPSTGNGYSYSYQPPQAPEPEQPQPVGQPAQQSYQAPQPPEGQQAQQNYQPPQGGQPPYGQQSQGYYQYQSENGQQQPSYGQPNQPYSQQQPGQPYGQQYNYYPGYEQKSKLVAGLLGIFLGAWGVHNFYLGFTTKAVIQIIVTLATCGVGALWGFIEGILYICGNMNTDSNGIPLKP